MGLFVKVFTLTLDTLAQWCYNVVVQQLELLQKLQTNEGLQMKKLLATLLCGLLAGSMLTACASTTETEESYITLDETLASEEYAIGFRADDVALAQAVQDILDDMCEEGVTATISETWFGTDLFITGRDWPREAELTADDTSLDDIIEAGVLVMGLDDSFPPMGFRDEDNNIVGFDVDLATEVCARLGIELVLQPIDWDSKELELEAGNIDCVWNGMTATEERAEAMYLSQPYLDNEQVIIVAESSGITTLDDLEGLTIGLQSGSSAVEAYEASDLVNTTEVVEYADNVSVFLDLQAGRVDAFLVDAVAGNYIVANDGDI